VLGFVMSSKILKSSLPQPIQNAVVVTCGALTRTGSACRAKPAPGSCRCRMHGGASTGPTSAEGRQRIRVAQFKRWRAWRAQRAAAGLP
jgi:hypothetical protein